MNKFLFLLLSFALALVTPCDGKCESQHDRLPKLPKAIAIQLSRELIKNGEVDQNELDEKFGKGKIKPSDFLSVRTINLNGDHIPELLVASDDVHTCQSHNCEFWIYRKTKGSFELILEGSDSLAGPIRLLKSVTNGYHDLSVIQQASCCEHVSIIYKFGLHTYQPVVVIDLHPDHGRYPGERIDHDRDKLPVPEFHNVG